MVEDLVNTDKDIPDDVRTMDELRKKASTVFNCMQFTTEFPSIREEGMVPVLDLQMYIVGMT